MLSVGVYTYSTKPRGSVVHATGLAEALVAAGHDATVYALAKPAATWHRRLACSSQLIAAADAPADSDALIRQRIDEFVSGFRILDMRHDIFHAQDCLAASALLAARARIAGPMVRTVHHVERFESAYLADCQRRSILSVDAVFSVSRRTQRDVLEQFGRTTRLVDNAVDADRFLAVRPGGRQWLQSRYGAAVDDVIVLSVGGVEPRKNPTVALAAIARAYAIQPRLRWIIVGGHSLWDHSDYIARFEAECALLPADLRARIVRAGTLSEQDMTSLYSTSDILLCPSIQEGFGLCVLEAMAAGAAVVVPGRGPFTEYLDANCAKLVDPGSVDSVAQALVELAVDPRLRSRLVAAARVRARRFSWSRAAATHLSHYESIRSGAYARVASSGSATDA